MDNPLSAAGLWWTTHGFCQDQQYKAYNGRYLGYYLHGELITNENQRAIAIDGKGFIVDKKDICGRKLTSLNQATPYEIRELEFILSEPQPEPKTYTSNFNNFTPTLKADLRKYQ